MKRFTMIMAMVVMMVTPVFAERVTPETARKVATTFLNNNGVKAELHLIDYADREAFPNFYVFGTENSFVIISADDCVQPVLGYSAENPFGTEKMPENIFWWLKGYDEQIADAAKIGQKATSEVAQQWKELVSGNASKAKSEVIVGPLIETQWNQFFPYNKLCPGGNATGCVATAMAQIMKYWSTVYESEIYANPTGFWNYLTKGFGSHSYTPTAHPEYGEQSVNFGNTTYDWTNMLSSYSGEYSETQANAIAKLMYHCGVSVDMNYGNSGSASGTQTWRVADALITYFNYSQTARYIMRADIVDEAGQEDLEQWENMLKAELTANPRRPILYRGKNSSGGGHAFICDGYETDANNNDKFHFNWGWGGEGNGSFVIITNIEFSIDQAAIFGIQPISYDAKPSGLVTSLSNRNVNLTWDEVGSASSYNVYRNYILIATDVNTNSFTDINVPIGDYVYYVRSVDSQGNVSLPSDMANVTMRFECTSENLTIEHLEMSYQGGNAMLQWKAPYSLQYLDIYSFEGDYGPLHVGEITFYWGACFPASLLVSGSSLTSVSTYFYTPGAYTAYVYQCSSKAAPSGNPITVSGTYSKGWHTIPIETMAINNEPYVWVVFKSSGIDIPTIAGIQSVIQNANESNYYSIDSTAWNHFNGYAFFVSASFTDSNFTYNIYDNGNKVVEGLNVPIHTLSEISSDAVHQYTVKAKFGEAESSASNMVGMTLGTASINDDLTLNVNDKMTIAENSALFVSGDLINTNPDNFILEDGAQLVTGSENVQATVMKNIDPASNWGEGNYTADGWYFIASPIVSTPDYQITGMITKDETSDETVIHTFDLYRYNQSADREWENFWGHNTNTSPFTIDNRVGYLYASKNGTTIRFKGIINPYRTTNNIVTLSQNGWNLIGNPFTCAVTVSKAFCELNNGSSVTNKDAGDTIKPCAGIAVYGNEGDEVVFTKLTPQEAALGPSNLNITLTQQVVNRDGANAVTIDNAVVSFNESEGLPKFTLLEASSKLYIPQDNEEYAIVSTEAFGEMPINFKANENGTYTLTVSPENVEMNYLHLIDNLTGNDMDLLTTPSYTFEAKTTDYASRFRLVFASICEDVDDGDENFAFINDGNIIVYKEGVLQIVDLTGRIVYQGDAMNRVSTCGMTPGVYVLRLITDNGSKTQKIVIK